MKTKMRSAGENPRGKKYRLEEELVKAFRADKSKQPNTLYDTEEGLGRGKNKAEQNKAGALQWTQGKKRRKGPVYADQRERELKYLQGSK